MWAEGETHTTLVVYIGIMRIEFNHSLFLTHIWKWIETCVNTGSRLIESHYGCMEINHSWNLESNLSCKGFLCTGNWFDKLKGWRKHNLFCLMVPKLSLEQYYKLIHRLFRQSSLNEIWKQTIFSAKSSANFVDVSPIPLFIRLWALPKLKTCEKESNKSKNHCRCHLAIKLNGTHPFCCCMQGSLAIEYAKWTTTNKAKHSTAV